MSEPILLKDYKSPSYAIETVDLNIKIDSTATRVKSIMSCRKLRDMPLVLDGIGLELLNITIDSQALSSDQYVIDNKSLTIKSLPEKFVLETTVLINPQANKALSGLYMSNGNFCTQCEAEGFRNITYFIDRPDVMSVYTCTIEADESLPVLLSNGNLIDSGKKDDGTHWAKWHDPSKKPCYLFALVAGVFEHVKDEFITFNNRKVELFVYVENSKIQQASFALQSLKRAMAWDESVYQREYDLDRYMIVSVSDFNFGAMENKGLNIFNDRYILANEKTATDNDFFGVEVVVGHEYFHNWTGNRITLNNWFQLCLKEGLTVFREHGFAAAMSSPGLCRINEAKIISTVQFMEESGPMAHPVRPDKFYEINNFYTVTVYNKGSEVIRMLNIWLQDKVFYQAMQHYFNKYDGCAIAVEDFLQAMQEVSGKDMEQFSRWYTGVGVVELCVQDSYDIKEQTLTLHIQQKVDDDMPRVIPISYAFIDPVTGNIVQEDTVIFSSLEESFTFTGIKVKPLISLLRGFSAPVKLSCSLTHKDKLALIEYDDDSYVRWRNLLELYIEHLQKCLQLNKFVPFANEFVNVYKSILNCSTTNNGEKVQILTLPSVQYILHIIPGSDVLMVHDIKQKMESFIANTLHKEFLSLYNSSAASVPYSFNKQDVALRSIRNFCLNYLVLNENQSMELLCQEQLKSADNMTDKVAAISAIVKSKNKGLKASVLSDFYKEWQDESLVIDKWFSLQASYATISELTELTQHPSFDWHNPNRVRALLGFFTEINVKCFHALSGEGYDYLTQAILKIDLYNPQLASRLVMPLIKFKEFDSKRRALMQERLLQIKSRSNVSIQLLEVVSRAVSERT